LRNRRGNPQAGFEELHQERKQGASSQFIVGSCREEHSRSSGPRWGLGCAFFGARRIPGSRFRPPFAAFCAAWQAFFCARPRRRAGAAA
jgi:hypothetical protein